MAQVAHSILSAARAADVGRSTITAAVATGRLPAHKLGTRTLIPAEALKAWIAALPAHKGTLRAAAATSLEAALSVDSGRRVPRNSETEATATPEPAHSTLPEVFAAALREIDGQGGGRSVAVHAVEFKDWLASLPRKNTIGTGGDR
jgi:excisionase family DNA binding protein